MTTQEIIDLAGHRQVPPWAMKLVGDCVAKEREECAKLADVWVRAYDHPSEAIARSIRARGNTTQVTPQDQKREWIGLTRDDILEVTRDDILEVVNTVYKNGVIERDVVFAKLISAKLKEKNT